MNSNYIDGPLSIDWHDEEVARLNGELAEYHDALSEILVEDVKPTDLVIGGLAVKDVLEGVGAQWVVGPSPAAQVTLERWAVDGNMVVRLAKSRNDASTRQQAGLLANQVRGTGRWIPGAIDRRTAKIAHLARSSLRVVVSVYETDALISEIDDDKIQAMRTAVQGNQPGGHGFVKRLSLHRNDIAPLNKPEVVSDAESSVRARHGWVFIERSRRDGLPLEQVINESFKAESYAQLRAAEVNKIGQSNVNTKLEKLHDDAVTMDLALIVLQSGYRIRPSKAQHTV